MHMDLFLKQNLTENNTVSEEVLGLNNWHFLMKSKPLVCQKPLISRAQNSGILLQSLCFFLNVCSGT